MGHADRIDVRKFFQFVMNTKSLLGLIIGLVLLVALLIGRGNHTPHRLAFPFQTATQIESTKDSSEMPSVQLPTQRVRAPQFPREFAWVNTDRPLHIGEELKGNVVVLDFWTYCCINCMHILPDLAYIEEKYAGQPVVVIGVHSAKFDNESDKQNIDQACQRYNIAHPVIVDERHEIWSEYAVNSWPTLMIIDSEGKVVGALSGEGNREVLDDVVSALLIEGKRNGTLAKSPPQFERKSRVPSASGLAFPGKVLAEPNGEYLFISDSNHNRVIISNLDGKVVAIAGSGAQGSRDGSFATAEFHNPQGIAFDGDHTLYVADTDNHSIRALDLEARSVQTISGTGKQVYDRTGGGKATAQGLNSPWDLALVDGKLYIAMAGPHQLWVLDLSSGIAENWVGSGREDIIDGSGTAAALAQPSGIVRKGDWLYFVDSEVSALRRVNIGTRKVETLVGTGLFNFGDRDGALNQATLQHPLGISVHGEDLLIADTYNHKVRRVNERERKITTLVGGDAPDAIASPDGELNLYEPGGLSVRGDTMYVADTNHDRIIVYNLSSGDWRELKLQGLQVEHARHMDSYDLPSREIKFAPGRDLVIRVTPEFTKGIHLNAEAPINYAFMSLDEGKAVEGLAKNGILPVEFAVPASSLQAGAQASAMLSIAYCTDGNSGLCVPVTLGWRLNLIEDPAANNIVNLTEEVRPIH